MLYKKPVRLVLALVRHRDCGYDDSDDVDVGIDVVNDNDDDYSTDDELLVSDWLQWHERLAAVAVAVAVAAAVASVHPYRKSKLWQQQMLILLWQLTGLYHWSKRPMMLMAMNP